jgi:hypothetical protein
MGMLYTFSIDAYRYRSKTINQKNKKQNRIQIFLASHRVIQDKIPIA